MPSGHQSLRHDVPKSRPTTIDYCRMPGKGETTKEAKQDAVRKLEQLVLDCLLGPVTVTMRGYTALVFRGTETWCMGLVVTDGAASNGAFCYTSGYDTFEVAQYAAARHVGYLAWTTDVKSDDDFAAEVSRLVRRLDNARLYEEALNYFRRQRRYAAAKTKGLTDAEAHKVACD